MTVSCCSMQMSNLLPEYTLVEAESIDPSGAVLKLSPGDKDGVACKAVVLIELARFEEAIEHIDGHLSQFRELSFEKVWYSEQL